MTVNDLVDAPAPFAAWARREHPSSPIPGLDGLAFGADYNPEQWPREVWHGDVHLMREAGVTMVTIGMWSWSKLDPGGAS